jgi:hypothetical protein
MNPTDSNSGAVGIEATLPFDLISPWGAEIKIMMVCEPAPTGAKNFSMSPLQCRMFWVTQVKAARWFDPDKECVVVLCLNRKNQVKAWNLVSLGTAHASLLRPLEVFRPAIAAAASAIIVMHNHPSGDPAPSGADFIVTDLLQKAADTLDIPLLDHIIIGDVSNDIRWLGYFSFKEHLWEARQDARQKQAKRTRRKTPRTT